ncbi:hypothetical protein FRC03_004519 [Tulasnella sp. 419]|nr:hypothetical protein FRC02_007195 [Tulasnella sp. 418]KAG8941447.1 hypothetical protein FRC03_004519 [Tulasnella sp. 419]
MNDLTRKKTKTDLGMLEFLAPTLESPDSLPLLVEARTDTNGQDPTPAMSDLMFKFQCRPPPTPAHSPLSDMGGAQTHLLKPAPTIHAPMRIIMAYAMCLAGKPLRPSELRAGVRELHKPYYDQHPEQWEIAKRTIRHHLTNYPEFEQVENSQVKGIRGALWKYVPEKTGPIRGQQRKQKSITPAPEEAQECSQPPSPSLTAESTLAPTSPSSPPPGPIPYFTPGVWDKPFPQSPPSTPCSPEDSLKTPQSAVLDPHADYPYSLFPDSQTPDNGTMPGVEHRQWMTQMLEDLQCSQFSHIFDDPDDPTAFEKMQDSSPPNNNILHNLY